MEKQIPFDVLKLLVGFPCEFTQYHTGGQEKGFLESVSVVGDNKIARVGVWNVKPERIVPVLKDMSDLTPDQINAFFKIWFETRIGIEEAVDGTTVNCRVIEIERIGEYKFRVVTENTWTNVMDTTLQEPNNPLKTTDEELWEFLPGSMEYLPVPAFFYLVSLGVDVWGLIGEGLAKHYHDGVEVPK